MSEAKVPPDCPAAVVGPNFSVSPARPKPVGLRPPTMAELVVMIQRLPAGPQRDFLEDGYWAKAVDRYGVRRAGWYRAESRWLREAGW